MIRLFYFSSLFLPFTFHIVLEKPTSRSWPTFVTNSSCFDIMCVRWDVSIVRGSPGLAACPIGFILHPCGNVPRRTRPTGTRVLVHSSLLKHRQIVPDMICSWFIFSCCCFPQSSFTDRRTSKDEICVFIALLPSLYQIGRFAVVKLGSKTNPDANLPPWIVTLPVALGFIPVWFNCWNRKILPHPQKSHMR